MRLALGTAQFGLNYGIANQNGQVPHQEAKEMLQLAAANHIDTLDTAIDYGESESCLGKLGIQDFKIVTKLPAVPDGCADINIWVQEQVALSLTRLGVNSIYGLLLHRSWQLLGSSGKALYNAMQALKNSGQVLKTGISIYSPNELEAITKLFPLDLVQAPFNLVDRRLHTTNWLHRLKDSGVEIHTRSVFLQGLLLMAKPNIPPKFAAWCDLWTKWHEWIANHEISAVQTCLAFPFAFPEIDRIVVGTDSISQLEQIINAANNTFLVDLPDLSCDAENLINPAFWNKL